MRLLAYIVFSLTVISAAHAGDGRWQTHLAGNDIMDLEVTGDEIFSASDGGLIIWNKDSGDYRQLTREDGLISNQLRDITVDQNGDAWLIYENNSFRSTLEKLSGNEVLSYDQSNSVFGDYRIKKVFADSKGTIWVGTVSGGVFELNDGSWKNHKPNAILNKSPLKVFVDPDGLLWLSNSDGVLTFDGSNWENITAGSEIDGIVINDILLDNDGVFWFATLKGVLAYDGASWTMYDKSDGLININVNSIAMTRDGVIWAGTKFGVSSFDGVSWKSYTGAVDLVDDFVSDVVVDANDNVWIVHDNDTEGLTKYNGTEWEWYTIWNRQDEAFPSNYVWALSSDSSGAVYIATDSGIYRKNEGLWENIASESDLKSLIISELYVDSDDMLWVIYNKSERAGFSSFDGTDWQHHTVGVANESVTTFHRDEEGVLYVGTTQGVSIGDGSNWIHYPDNNSLESPDVADIAEDDDGVMWFATGKGISRYDGQLWNTYSTGVYLNDDLTNIYVTQAGDIRALSSFGVILEFNGETAEPFLIEGDFDSDGTIPKAEIIAYDNDGDLWMDIVGNSEYDVSSAEWVRPLWKLQDGIWERHDIISSLPFNEITEIIADNDGTLWLASDAGLIHYDGDDATIYRTQGPVSNEIRHIAVDAANTVFLSTNRGLTRNVLSTWNYISAMLVGEMEFDHDNVLWMSNSGGIASYDNGEITVIPSDDISEEFHRTISITIDDNNDKWLGTNWGLWRYDGLDFTMYGREPTGIIGGVKAIAVTSQSVVWMGIGLNRGLWRFEDGEWQNFLRVDGVSGDNVNVTMVDNNDVLWVGTRNGISSYNDTTWTTYTEVDGLVSDNILSIEADNNNVIWVGTDNGVSSFDGESWTSFTIDDGLVDNQVTNIAVDNNNVKWFGTPRGLSAYDDRDGSTGGSAFKSVSVLGNYPNPFNVETSIEFNLHSWGDVKLAIYNIAGQKIREYRYENLPAGRKQLIWNGLGEGDEKVSSGVYFYRLSQGSDYTGGRMMLLK